MWKITCILSLKVSLESICKNIKQIFVGFDLFRLCWSLVSQRQKGFLLKEKRTETRVVSNIGQKDYQEQEYSFYEVGIFPWMSVTSLQKA